MIKCKQHFPTIIVVNFVLPNLYIFCKCTYIASSTNKIFPNLDAFNNMYLKTRVRFKSKYICNVNTFLFYVNMTIVS